MATVRLDTNQITDWASFHLLCKEAFGFPDFYGMNMDAWIDCMSDNLLSEDEMLYIEITETEKLNSRLPDILDGLIECSAFVNNRYIDAGQNIRISLIFL